MGEKKADIRVERDALKAEANRHIQELHHLAADIDAAIHDLPVLAKPFAGPVMVQHARRVKALAAQYAIEASGPDPEVMEQLSWLRKVVTWTVVAAVAAVPVGYGEQAGGDGWEATKERFVSSWSDDDTEVLADKAHEISGSSRGISSPPEAPLPHDARPFPSSRVADTSPITPAPISSAGSVTGPAPSPSEAVGQSLRGLREASGLPLDEFARGVGIDPHTYAVWEAGEDLPPGEAIDDMGGRLSAVTTKENREAIDAAVKGIGVAWQRRASVEPVPRTREEYEAWSMIEATAYNTSLRCSLRLGEDVDALVIDTVDPSARDREVLERLQADVLERSGVEVRVNKFRGADRGRSRHGPSVDLPRG